MYLYIYTYVHLVILFIVDIIQTNINTRIHSLNIYIYNYIKHMHCVYVLINKLLKSESKSCHLNSY